MMLMLRQANEGQLLAPPGGQEEKRWKDGAVLDNKHSNGRRQWGCQRFEPKQVAAAW